MSYILEKAFPQMEIERIVKETEIIREQRGGVYEEEEFRRCLSSIERAVDPETDNFLCFQSTEEMGDRMDERYLFRYQSHYYLFSCMTLTDPPYIMFYKETPPLRDAQVFSLLMNDLKQAFLCAGWWFTGLSEDEKIKEENKKAILNLIALDELDNFTNTYTPYY